MGSLESSDEKLMFFCNRQFSFQHQKHNFCYENRVEIHTVGGCAISHKVYEVPSKSYWPCFHTWKMDLLIIKIVNHFTNFFR